MITASQINEHMAVKGSDGKHVGTVIGTEGDRLKLISGGMDHDIDLSSVEAVEKFIFRVRFPTRGRFMNCQPLLPAEPGRFPTRRSRPASFFPRQKYQPSARRSGFKVQRSGF